MRNILLILLITYSSVVLAQQEKKIIIPDLSKDLVVFIDSLDSIKSNNEYFTMKELNSWWNGTCAFESKDAFSKSLDYKTKAIKALHGLRFQANYNKNFELAIDDDENLSYTSRFYLGLEWELLRNGFLASRAKAKKSVIDNEIKNINYNREVLRSKEAYIKMKIDQTFNAKIRLLLIRKLAIEKKLHELHRFLSFEKSYSKTHVLDKLEEVYTTKNKLNNIIIHDSVEIPYKNLPFLKLDLKTIDNYSKHNNLDSLVLANRIKALNTGNYIYNNWSLRPNFRYNHYNGINNTTRRFTSAGVSLSIPLSTGRNSKKYRETNIEYLKEKDSYRAFYKDENLRLLKDKSVLYQIRLSRALRDKRIQDVRIQSIKNRMHISPSSISGVELLNELSVKVSKEISILETNRIIYNNFLKISTLLDGVEPSEFCTHIIDESKYERTIDPRYIYIWSSFIKSVSASSLIKYLNEADIKNVLLSFGKLRNSESYISKLKVDDINTELLIGYNGLLDKDEDYIRAYIRKKLEYDVNGIHLDIEPHAIQSWKFKKQEYYKKLLEIYTISKQECEAVNKTLGVSIPVFYSADFLKKINPICDKVFIMAYGSSNPNVIIKNLKEELEILDKNKLVIALNNPDFRSSTELEIVIDKITKYTSCKTFAYHKASNFFTLIK